MIIEPCTCTCSPPPLVSNKQTGCELVDGVDDEGNRWHGYRAAGQEPCWLTVVAASEALQARQAEESAAAQATQTAGVTARARVEELKTKMATEQLTSSEMQELLLLVL